MANIKSAIKAYRQDRKRRAVNGARRSALKTAVKKLHVSLAQDGASAEALEQQLRAIAAQLARARSKGVMKRNTASRTLSRLSLRVNALRG